MEQAPNKESLVSNEIANRNRILTALQAELEYVENLGNLEERITKFNKLTTASGGKLYGVYRNSLSLIELIKSVNWRQVPTQFEDEYVLVGSEEWSPEKDNKSSDITVFGGRLPIWFKRKAFAAYFTIEELHYYYSTLDWNTTLKCRKALKTSVSAFEFTSQHKVPTNLITVRLKSQLVNETLIEYFHDFYPGLYLGALRSQQRPGDIGSMVVKFRPPSEPLSDEEALIAQGIKERNARAITLSISEEWKPRRYFKGAIPGTRSDYNHKDTKPPQIKNQRS